MLSIATHNAAELLGQLDNLGTIEPGKQADLVLLDANPLVDISSTRRIAAVIADGRFYGEADLAAIRERAAALAPSR